MTEPTGNEIAVIGVAGIFPGAPDLPSFWRNLRAGVESVSRFDDDELGESPLYPGLRGHQGFVPAGAVIEGADLFDHDLFGLPRREARWMDPQQRVFLQLAWAALEDGGYDPARYGGRISVYAGAGNSGHLQALLGHAGSDPASLYEAVGGAAAENLATRVSYLLRLRGESMNVHTACSTGLTVVHLACQSLLLGQSSLALAGAVSLSVPQRTGYVHQEGMILSPDGHCRAFDHRAGGTVPGHGAAVVLLKPLQDALADGDHVHAVILGSAVNNEGHRSVGYTAPSVTAQAEVITEALAFADTPADDIGYIEAHGTGTPLGDPIEITALTRAFRQSSDRVGDCLIGSVKTNIGHLDTAAGMAGLVKVILMLRHREIPPSLHLERPNPAIDFATSPFTVNTRLRPWPGDRPRLAGVSSFGIGGTNVHAVLAEPPAPPDPAPSQRPHHLVTLAAHTPAALASMAAELADAVANAAPGLSLADLAYTRAVGRAELRHRRYQVAADADELVAALRQPVRDRGPVTAPPRVGFLFPGHGSASQGMAAGLYRAEPAFRDELDACVAQLQPLLARPLEPVLLTGEVPITDAELGHAALFALEYALARLWQRWGVRPAALLGHSFGEYAAACVAGVLSLPEAAELAVVRGRLVAGLPAGAMAAVGLDEHELTPYLREPLALAAVNGAARCVVSGPVDAVAALRSRLAAAGHGTVALPVGHAFHSAAMDPVLADLRAAAARCTPGSPELPLLSSRTGTWWGDGDGGPEHWARQMRDPVRFGDALRTLAGDGGPLVLVEVGPDQALTTLARAELGPAVVVAPSLPRAASSTDGHRILLAAVGTVWRAGATVDWPAFHAGERRRRVPLPTYPFEAVDCALAPIARPVPVASPDTPESVPLSEVTDDLPAAAAPGDGPRDELERRVFDLWADRLGTTEFGIHDNFLELGGNSLVAAQLITRLRAAFPVALPLGALFEAPTVAGLADRLRAALGGADSADRADRADGATAEVEVLPPIRPVPRDGELPLSVVQARTLELEARDPGNPGLAMPFAIELDGVLDQATLTAAVRTVLGRHETLRTTFHRTADGSWTQRLHPVQDLRLELRELSGTDGERTAAAQQLAREEAGHAFDLSRSPLRLLLLRLAETRHVLLVTVHHVVCDTLSMVNFVQEVVASYQGLPLPPLAVQYADFAAWQRQLLSSGALRRQQTYWQQRLRDLPALLALPTDRPRASEHGIRSDQLATALPSGLSQRVAELAQRLGTTPFVTLLAAFAALLGRVSGADDVVVGTPIGNREHGGLEPLIGYVAHAVPLRLDLTGDPGFTELVTRAREAVLAAHAHPDLPYEELVAGAGVARERLFDAMFVLHSGIPQEQATPGLTWRLWEVPDMPAMFGATLATVSLMLTDSPQGLAGNLEYARELFDPGSAQRLCDQFATLVDDVVRRPRARLSELVLDRSPAPTSLTATDPPSWLDRWAATVARQPDAVAVTGADASLTRAELAAQADRIAAALHERGQTRVGLDLPPSARRLVLLLGALRAGCAVAVGLAAPGCPEPAPDGAPPTPPGPEATAFVEPERAWSQAEVARYLASLEDSLGEAEPPGPLLAAEEPCTVGTALDLLWAVVTGRPVLLAPEAAALAEVPWVPPASRSTRAVQFSLSYFANDEDALSGPKYQLLLDGVRRADELGLTAVWTPERHFHSFGGLYPSPTATSAALAAASRRLGIRAGSVVLPLHEPVRVAEDWAVIDNLSGGRVGVSFASGWHPDDFVLAPDRYADRREAMYEGIDVVRRLWRGEAVRRRNGVGEQVEIAIRPRPVQPELPFWLTAASSPDTFRLAGELGGYLLTNLMAQSMDDLAGRIELYRQAWRQAGHPGSGHVTLMLHTFLADDAQQARTEAREPLLRYFRSSVGIARGLAVSQGLTVGPEDLSEDDLQAMVEHGLERYLNDSGLFGTPDSTASVVERVRELGVDEVAALIDFGVSATATLRCVELLAELADRESTRASAAADSAALDLQARVAGLGRQATQADAALVLATPDVLAWLAEVAPQALAGRTLLSSAQPRPDARVSVRHRLPDGRWITARATTTAGPELTVRPAPGLVATVVDAAGRDPGVGVVGRLLLDGTPTGQRARRRPDGRLDLLAAPRPAAPRTDGGISRADRDRPLPLSYAQQRLWYLDQLVPGNIAYNNTVALRMRGPLDTTALHQALCAVVRRHEVLRTTISATPDGAVQVIHPDLEPDLPVTEVRDDLDTLVRELARTPFDLTSGPLLRAHLLRLAEAGQPEHLLVIGLHHIVSDGWSAGVLLGELAALYATYQAAGPDEPTELVEPLEPLPVQYADYAVWQRNQADTSARELAYWAQTLAGVPQLELPLDRPRGPVQGQYGARSPVRIGPELTAAVNQLCRETGVTPYMVLHAVLVTLLHRYSGQTDLAVGTAVAGRNQPETEHLVGCFINTVVVRTDLSGAPTFRELLGRVREATLGAVAHQDLPFERLVDELDVPRSLSHAPLVQAMLVLHNTPSPRVQLGELTLEGVDLDSGTCKLDLVLELREDQDGIGGAWEYNTELFDEATLRQLTEHLLRLLAAAVARPERPIGEYDLLGEQERQQVAALSAGAVLPARTEPNADTVSGAFLAQVARTPDTVAIGRLTYRDLAIRAGAVAHRLAARGIGRGDRVALLTTDPADTITAMLGVLLAGAAYVPLDPNAPPARRDTLLDRAAPAAVLTGAEIADLTVDPPAEPPRGVATGPSDPAYLIFTSGSTGQPKGVLVTHGQLLHSTRARRAHYGPPGVCLNLYALTFDGSVGWIYYALLTGGTVVCPQPHELTEPHRLIELVTHHRPQRLATVPALYRQLLAAATPGQLASLRSATVGGEACPPDLVRAHTELLADTELHNEYGPTEATVWSTVHQVRSPVRGRVPIGRPVPGTRGQVLDAAGRPLPVGATGEWYVGGPTVATGYLGAAGLTAQRFVPDPFGAPGARLYRTGDRVRWNRQGLLEYLGRADRQVKVRGFRVEPAEIEAVLTSHPAVTEAVVIASGGRLLGYVAPDRVEVAQLQAFAQARLPEHLVPAQVVALPDLPRTRHGKLDQRALPDLQQPADSTPVAPRTDLERTLAEVVAEVLGRTEVGLHDDFHALGGDSILAMSVVTRARQRSVELTVRQLFHNPTVASLALVAGTRLDVQAEQGTVAGPAPLSPIQRWFFALGSPRPWHFTLPVQLTLHEPVRPDLLQQAFHAVLHHHDALRLRFVADHGRWHQHGVPAEPDWSLDQADLADETELAALDQKLQESLDLADGPLLRAALVRLGSTRTDRLLLVAHHLVVDAVSWRIVLADLFTAYRQLAGGHQVTLPPKTTPYAEWAGRLGDHATSAAGQAELGYWTSQPYHLAPRLPRDGDGPDTHADTRTLRTELDPARTAALLRGAVPVEHAVLAAVAGAVASWAGAGHVQLDIERHGREDLLPDLDVTRTVGWFSDFHPVVLTTQGDLHDLSSQLDRVPHRGAGYVPLRYGVPDSPLRAVPPSEITVNYLGQLDLALPAGVPAAVVGEQLGSLRADDTPRPYLIEVTAGVLDGRLWLVWSYGEGTHHRSTIERLARHATDTLSEVR